MKTTAASGLFQSTMTFFPGAKAASLTSIVACVASIHCEILTASTSVSRRARSPTVRCKTDPFLPGTMSTGASLTSINLMTTLAVSNKEVGKPSSSTRMTKSYPADVPCS